MSLTLSAVGVYSRCMDREVSTRRRHRIERFKDGSSLEHLENGPTVVRERLVSSKLEFREHSATYNRPAPEPRRPAAETLSPDRQKLFERMAEQLNRGKGRPSELDDPQLKEEYLRWRGSEERAMQRRVQEHLNNSGF